MCSGDAETGKLSIFRAAAGRGGACRAVRPPALSAWGKPMLARRFLWIVAGLTVLVMAGALLYRLFEPQLMKFALVPTSRFQSAPAVDPHAYDAAGMWIARPDIPGNPSLWTPQ